MSAMRHPRVLIVVLLTLLTLAALPSSADANHSWGGYHWARTRNPFTIKLGDNVSGPWDAMLRTASSDWSKSKVLDTTVVAGSNIGNEKRCSAVRGRVEVCSADYGGVQWLGVASVWLTNGHISQGTVKNNDHYFGNSTYAYNNT